MVLSGERIVYHASTLADPLINSRTTGMFDADIPPLPSDTGTLIFSISMITYFLPKSRNGEHPTTPDDVGLEIIIPFGLHVD